MFHLSPPASNFVDKLRDLVYAKRRGYLGLRGIGAGDLALWKVLPLWFFPVIIY
jgi:hypothetical protein